MRSLSIGEVAKRAGVAEGTLRMWELRHGFPVPERLPSGHRRYSEDDVELVTRVAAQRAAGVTLAAAIARAQGGLAPQVASLYATLRRRRPELEAQTLSKRVLVALSHAIEDESLSRADRPVLFASFQRERFYRREAARWAELAIDAEMAFVFADFDRLCMRGPGPAEIPVSREDPLAREWAIVCDAGGHAVCLTAWEPPSSAVGPEPDRYFESIWSVEPEVVREASRVCAGIVATAAPEQVDLIGDRLHGTAVPAGRDQLRLASAITNRTLYGLSQATRR